MSEAMRLARIPVPKTGRNEDIRARYMAGERVTNIALRYAMTRQAVWKVLRSLGVETTERQAKTGTCAVCGAPLIIRRGKQGRESGAYYCGKACYMAHLIALGETYKPSAYHCRVARRLVAERFAGFDPAVHVVHHVDGVNRHNNIGNLWVFASQTDHLRYHRGYPVSPIWQGR